MSFLRSFWRDETGQDLVEYTLLIAFIAMACFAVLGSTKQATVTIWQRNANRLGEADNVIPPT